MGWKVPELRERLTMLVIVGMSTEEHFLRSQVGIGSASDCSVDGHCLHRRQTADTAKTIPAHRQSSMQVITCHPEMWYRGHSRSFTHGTIW